MATCIDYNGNRDLINQISEGLKSTPIQYSIKILKKNYQKSNVKRSAIILKIKYILYSLNNKGQPGFDVITPFETIR